MKTMVAIPCMDTIQTEFAASLIRMRPVGMVSTNFMPCSLIYKARNDLVDAALAEKVDFVLWIDSDMVFPSDLLIDMMADMEGRDIVTGVCHMRRPPFRPVLYKKLRAGVLPEENEHENYDDYPRDKIFEIEGCGMACTMVRAEVLQTVVDRFHDAFAPIPGYGEDLSFCIRARECGFKIHCDPKLQIGHKAATIVTDETFQAFRRAGGMK